MRVWLKEFNLSGNALDIYERLQVRVLPPALIIMGWLILSKTNKCPISASTLVYSII